ncbi:septum formation initiator family protein [Desulfovibrio sp. OttesenSCG-928-A18]|nr:septum formation initiator family protein [Desulfovibrio sp. OttesenSCG-928-A18]
MLARRIVLIVSILLNLVLVYNLIWGKSGAIAYQDLREQCDSLEARIKTIGEENLELSREIHLLQTDAKYQEKVIRNRLNFVRENEILYTFPGGGAGEKAGATPHETEN